MSELQRPADSREGEGPRRESARPSSAVGTPSGPHPRFGLSRLAGPTVLRGAYLLRRLYELFVRPVTLGVRIMMIREGQVLLVRQTYTSGWFLPGGGVGRGETLDAAARREAGEEAGAMLRNLSLVGAYTSFDEWRSDHNVLFLSTDFSLSGEKDQEIAELRFFPLDALPEGLSHGHRERLEEYRAHQASPQFGRW